MVPGRLCNVPGLDVVGAWEYPVRSEEGGMGVEWVEQEIEGLSIGKCFAYPALCYFSSIL